MSTLQLPSVRHGSQWRKKPRALAWTCCLLWTVESPRLRHAGRGGLFTLPSIPGRPSYATPMAPMRTRTRRPASKKALRRFPTHESPDPWPAAAKGRNRIKAPRHAGDLPQVLARFDPLSCRGCTHGPGRNPDRDGKGRLQAVNGKKSQGATTKKAVSWTGPSQSIHVWTAKEVKPIHSLGRWPGAQGGNLIAFLLAGMRAQGARGKGLPAGQDTIRQCACATVPSMAPRPAMRKRPHGPPAKGESEASPSHGRQLSQRCRWTHTRARKRDRDPPKTHDTREKHPNRPVQAFDAKR